MIFTTAPGIFKWICDISIGTNLLNLAILPLKDGNIVSFILFASGLGDQKYFYGNHFIIKGPQETAF